MSSTENISHASLYGTVLSKVTNEKFISLIVDAGLC